MYYSSENEEIMKTVVQLLTFEELNNAVAYNILFIDKGEYHYHENSLRTLRLLKEKNVLLFPSIFRLVISQNTPEIEDYSIKELNNENVDIYDTLPPNKTERFEDEKFSITVLDVVEGSIYVKELVEGLLFQDALEGVKRLSKVFGIQPDF